MKNNNRIQRVSLQHNTYFQSSLSVVLGSNAGLHWSYQPTKVKLGKALNGMNGCVVTAVALGWIGLG